MSLKNRLIRGTLSMLLLRAFSMVLMLVLNGYLTRRMPPEQIASYVAGTNLLILISLIGMAGLNQSMLRLVSGKKDRSLSNKELIWSCWKVAICSTGVVTIVSLVLLRSKLGEWLNLEPKVFQALLACSILISVHKLFATSLRSVHSIASSSVFEGRSGGPLSNAAYFVILIVWPASSLSADLALWFFAAGLLITAPVGYVALRKSLSIQEHGGIAETGQNVFGSETGNILLFSAPFLVTQLLTYFSTEFDILIASAYTTPEATALFGTARRLLLQALTPMQILSAAMGGTIAELYAKGERKKLQNTLRYAALIGCVVTIPVLFCCIAVPEMILGLVFGNFYRDAATVFSILAVGQILNCLTGQCLVLLMLSGNARMVIVTNMAAAICLTVSGSAAAQQAGINGLATTSAIIVAIQNIILWLLARRCTGYWTHATIPTQE